MARARMSAISPALNDGAAALAVAAGAGVDCASTLPCSTTRISSRARQIPAIDQRPPVASSSEPAARPSRAVSVVPGPIKVRRIAAVPARAAAKAEMPLAIEAIRQKRRAERKCGSGRNVWAGVAGLSDKNFPQRGKPRRVPRSYLRCLGVLNPPVPEPLPEPPPASEALLVLGR